MNAGKKHLLAAGIAAAVAVVGLTLPSAKHGTPKPPPQPPRPLTVEQKVVLHLSAADMMCRVAAEKSLEPVSKLFTSARRGAKGYAEEVLSWNGKWELAKGAFNKLEQRIFGMPEPADDYWSNVLKPADPAQSHERYLATEFNRRVLAPGDLKTAIDAVLAAFLAEVEATEGRMLVAIRADVSNTPMQADDAELARLNEAFRQTFHKKIDELADSVARMHGQEAGTFAASMVLGNIATNVALSVGTQLGISSTIIGGSTVATLGVGVVVGLIVDHIINSLLKEFGHDPMEKIAKEVVGSLNNLERAVTASLQDELTKLHERRSKLRRETITTLLKEGVK